MPEIRPVVNESLSDFHVLFYNIKYLSNFPTFKIKRCLHVLEKAVAHM